MKKAIMLKIREYLDYNPETGKLVWKKAPNKNKNVGDVAGYTPPNTYARIRINSKLYFSHRIAWFLYYDEYPTQYVRHIDGDRTNNKIENLSIGRKDINKMIDSYVPPGIEYIENSKRWRVFYKKDSKKITIGYYKTKGSAIRAQQRKVSEE